MMARCSVRQTTKSQGDVRSGLQDIARSCIVRDVRGGSLRAHRLRD